MKHIAAFSIILILLSGGLAFPAADTVKQTVAAWTDGAPVIDGKLDEPQWTSAKAIGDFELLGDVPAKRPQAATTVKVLTDGKSLYVGFRCTEPRMDKLKTEQRPHDMPVWEDDSVEVIIDPTNGREKIYHLIANALGDTYDAVCTDISPVHAEDDPKWDGDWQVATSRSAGEWCAEWRIPFASLGISTESSRTLGANFARARMGSKQELSSWSCTSDLFTRPSILGEVVLPTADGALCMAAVPKITTVPLGKQDLALEVVSLSPKPISACVKYTLSGSRETIGTSDPFTVPAKGRLSVRIPLDLTELGDRRLGLAILHADSGQPMYSCARQLDVRPPLTIEESLYDLYARRATADVTVNLPASSPKGVSVEARLLTENSDEPLETKALKPPFDKPIRVSFDLAKRPKGTYFIEMTGGNGEGSLPTTRSKGFPYNPSPRIGFDKDGFMLIEDKPFFPIGMYTLQDGKGTDHDRVLKEAHDAGFNTTVFYAYTVDTVTPLLDAAARNGIKAFVYPTIPFSVRKKPLTDEDAIKDVIARRDHPALLGWYVVDEPEGIGKAAPRMVRDLYQTIKETDTEHPCSLVIMSARAAAEYRMDADVIWVDPYPIPGSPAAVVGDRVQGCVDAMTDGKPLWAVPQAFDWAVWNKGKIDKVHRPTDAEERCMTYLALVHGAKGIIYWAHTASRYYIEDYPDHWAYMKKLAGEMRDLTPVLLTTNSKRKLSVTSKQATIDTMVKELDGCVYLFAVNRDPVACTATFAPAGVKNAEVEVLFEDRALQARGGRWSDSFVPLGVHVYRLAVK